MKFSWLRSARGFAVAAIALLVLAVPRPATAYTTRVHIALANEIRDALIAGGGRSIKLAQSDAVVTIREEDARAIMGHPLAFRAGSIGPDNMIFPGMTDPSHALFQKPFEQCELLYQAALTDQERAYALGCFLHGSSDAVAHHYVNYLTGETFTLTPLASGREQEFSNVVRHIAAESMLEDAMMHLNPRIFDGGGLTHSIPIPFVQRAYFTRESPLYQMLSKRAFERFDRSRATRPDGRLQDVLAISALEPADHLVLSIVYLKWIDESLSALQGRFKSMQDKGTTDGARLGAGPGPDGRLGTPDDTTLCTATCAKLYAEYALYAHLMQPRYDAQGREMKSAFDKVTGKLHDDLATFVPVYLETVDNLSTRLNAPYVPGEKKVDIDVVDFAAVFRPMQDWAGRVATLDYDAAVKTVIPDVWLDFTAALQHFGISIAPVDILRLVMGPVVAQIEEVVRDYVVAQGTEYFRNFTAAYKSKYDSAKAEYAIKLRAAQPEGSPYLLDDLRSSGLYAHTFNITAAALADHGAVLPTKSDDPVGLGAASFDTSYSTHWMQVGLCEPLRKKVFPFGLGIKGLLSHRKDGALLEAKVYDEATVECHDGSLRAFSSSPTKESCRLVELDALIRDGRHRGSVTRGYPPELAATQPPTCVAEAAPAWLTTTEKKDGETEDDMTIRRTTDTTGCGCGTAGASKTTTGGIAGVAFALALFALRRRRAKSALVTAATAFALAGCSETTTSVDEEIIPGAKHPGTEQVVTTPAPGDKEPVEPLPEGLSPAAKELLTKLGNSVWHGGAARSGKSRAIELHFRASRLQWGEIQNPFGPARKRELRTMAVSDTAAVHAVVTNPNTWLDATTNGREGDYKLEVIEGSPRKLKVTLDGKSEEYLEGPEEAPTSGVTAVVRTFASSGKIDAAFCRASYFNSVDYVTMLNFARYGHFKSIEKEIGVDFVVGAKLGEWNDASGSNRFAVSDLTDFDRLGGTELTDQQNFFVHYSGMLDHPGGTFRMREADDVVADGMWSFLGSEQVGSNLVGDAFLEVQSRPWPDATVDAPSRLMPKGKIPFEVIVARCASTIKTVTIQGQWDTGPWEDFRYISTTPTFDPKLLTSPM
jgi:MYXO-CTERM domain-containing protein